MNNGNYLGWRRSVNGGLNLSTGEQWTVTDNIYPDMKLAEQQTKLF